MNNGPSPGVRFQRANFIVSDLDRALSLYRDILGFSLDFVKDSPDDSYSYPVFEIDRKANMRFAVLSTPSQQRVMALTEINNLPYPACLDPDAAPSFWTLRTLTGWLQAGKKLALPYMKKSDSKLTTGGSDAKWIGRLRRQPGCDLSHSGAGRLARPL